MMDRMGYWGYRFEGYSTIPVPPGQLTSMGIGEQEREGGGGKMESERIRQWKEEYEVDTHKEYCSVFSSRLGQTRLLMGAEVDCVAGK